jgi:hypothetical protein
MCERKIGGAVRLASLGLLALLAPSGVRAEEPNVDPQGVVLRVADEIERRYVDASLGRRVAERLRAAVRAGAYPAGTTGGDLAKRLTTELRDVTADGHLGVEFTATPLPEEDTAARAEMDRRDRDEYYGPRLNFGFRRAELLEGNIGYLDLTVFAPLDWGGETATATMTFLARADALVIDLRRNGGGHGEMAQWLASYLLGPEPRPLSGVYSRERDATAQTWSLPYVPGARFGPAKPVYVLTSRRTFSAAEGFAYDLQALGRVTVVGERTGGGAHPYENVKLDAHFVLWLPMARSVNPITGTNWTGGVRPDVDVKADDALETALRLARERISKRQ